MGGVIKANLDVFQKQFSAKVKKKMGDFEWGDINIQFVFCFCLLNKDEVLKTCFYADRKNSVAREKMVTSGRE